MKNKKSLDKPTILNKTLNKTAKHRHLFFWDLAFGTFIIPIVLFIFALIFVFVIPIWDYVYLLFLPLFFLQYACRIIWLCMIVYAPMKAYKAGDKKRMWMLIIGTPIPLYHLYYYWKFIRPGLKDVKTR